MRCEQLGRTFEREILFYLPVTDLADAPPGDGWREVRRMVEASDPYTEVSFAIHGIGASKREDACLLIRTPPGWATPPEAYQKVMAGCAPRAIRPDKTDALFGPVTTAR